MTPTQELDALPVASSMASVLEGNHILEIAYEVQALKERNQRIGNFTVGDFNNSEFRIPKKLEDLIVQHVRDGATNYPPAMGVLPLRQSVASMYREELGIVASPTDVLIASGTRPLIFAAYTAIVDPGDVVVHGLPSWNNNHYAHIVRANAVEITSCCPENNFMLTAQDLEPHLENAVLVALNSPMNPSGTVMGEHELREICELIVNTNRQRIEQGKKLCYLLFDQVYWRLNYDKDHEHPAGVLPEVEPYTIYLDGASKNYAGTGLRVGWAVVPRQIMPAMTNIIAHMGAWAPKAMQLALAEYLYDRQDQEEYFNQLRGVLHKRLNRLHATMDALKAEGYPVSSIRPMGGLFLSMYFGLTGCQTPDGTTLESVEDVRKYLLHTGRCAFVPFSAFGDNHNPGWFRASVAGITKEDFEYAISEFTAAIRALKLN